MNSIRCVICKFHPPQITSKPFLSTFTTNRPTDHFLDDPRSYQDYIRGKTSSVQWTVSHPSCHDTTIRRCKRAPWEYGVVITAVYLGSHQGNKRQRETMETVRKRATCGSDQKRGERKVDHTVADANVDPSGKERNKAQMWTSISERREASWWWGLGVAFHASRSISSIGVCSEHVDASLKV